MTTIALALRTRTFRSLRAHRNFRIFFAGQVVSLAGTWMQNVALAWLVLELTRSPLAVGALAFWRFVPFTVFGLVAGVVADRVDSRRLVMATQGAAMAVSVALAVVALTGTATLPVVYVLAALGGVALAFDAPGRQSLTFQMVGPKELPNAVALNTGLFNGSRIVGPAIGGLIIAAAGTGVCFALNALSFLAVLAALSALRVDELQGVEKDPSAGLFTGTRRALGFVRRDRQLLSVLAVVTVVSTVGFNFHVLVPLLAANTLDVGPEGLGLLSAAFGVGAVVGALATATFHGASWKVFSAGAVGFGVFALALAPVENAVLAAVLLVAVGVSFTLFAANANALVQLGSPDKLRGRLIGLYLFAFAGLAPIGGLLAGWLAELGGTRLAFSVGGVTSLAAIAVANAFRSPAQAPGTAGAVPRSEPALRSTR
ncbi:MAG TPA: MFS transporter [Gaiellaceae bacterium]|nr:MFS transporter [Gaiellaceae bacterium]